MILGLNPDGPGHFPDGPGYGRTIAWMVRLDGPTLLNVSVILGHISDGPVSNPDGPAMFCNSAQIWL